MLRCKDVAAQASAHIDGELSLWKRFQMRVHLAMCHGCNAFVTQLRETNELARHIAHAPEPPALDAANSHYADALSELRRKSQRNA